MDRRRDFRARVTETFANKYIDGVPHTVELLDVSGSGVMLRRILEPDTTAQAFSLELAVGDVRVWAWTRRVWRRDNREALHFMFADAVDRARLRKALRCAA